MVPLAPSWVISNSRKIIVQLVPDHKQKRFDFTVIEGASTTAVSKAERGTVQDGRLVYELGGETYSTPIKTIRGDVRNSDGMKGNALRHWGKEEFVPASDDVFQERLYCIQWIASTDNVGGRRGTFFAAPTSADIEREHQIEAYVRKHIRSWQNDGVVADLAIETGKENEGPIRTNGWAYWHQMFSPRQILYHALIRSVHPDEPIMSLIAAKCLDYCNKSSQWRPRGEYPEQLFSGPSLKTMFNWACRSSISLQETIKTNITNSPVSGKRHVYTSGADKTKNPIDYFITDPPYADSVRYEEITEFFIAWLRKNKCAPFSEWIWDSRRPLAIKGDGDEFRHNMVAAYKSMTEHMPNNGLQIVMFTHQDAGVWADMAQIFWGSGLRVMAAWYIATETTSELKKGGYVQGTVILVLRKREAGESGYKDEIVQEVKVEVAEQIDTMSGLNQSLKGHGRIENLFEDADLQMAGYAAALRVLTKYTSIDGIDMTKEAVRSRVGGEKGLVDDIIEFAVQVANEHMVPEGMSSKIWESLGGSERFFFKMMDIESVGVKKLDNYQNFSKAFRVARYDDLMGSMEPNNARLKSAKEFKKSGFEGSEFGGSKSRALLFAIYEIQSEVEGDAVISHLREMVPDYFNSRDDLMALADYVARKRASTDANEARAAGILHALIRNERFG